MLAYLRGDPLVLGPDYVICVVNDVGYRVTLSARTLRAIANLPSPVTLWIETVVREGETALFGFLDTDDQTWFRWLMGVPGVGARMALNLLSAFDPANLQALIAQENAQQLRSAEGVGPKLAVRIVHELRDKAHSWKPLGSTIPPLKAEALAALGALGYRSAEADTALTHVLQQQPDAMLPDLIRLALQYLSP